MPTEAEIDAAKTERGGWDRATLAGWGVPWPPPKGWRKQLIEGKIQPPADAGLHKIIQDMAMAAVNAGQTHLFYHLPHVLTYFGAQIPEKMEPQSSTAVAPGEN